MCVPTYPFTHVLLYMYVFLFMHVYVYVLCVKTHVCMSAVMYVSLRIELYSWEYNWYNTMLLCGDFQDQFKF